MAPRPHCVTQSVSVASCYLSEATDMGWVTQCGATDMAWVTQYEVTDMAWVTQCGATEMAWVTQYEVTYMAWVTQCGALTWLGGLNMESLTCLG